MPRSSRIDYAGAWQHVMNRGVDRALLFRDDIDRQRFLIELREAAMRHGVEVHAFCLMANHYHLLLCTPRAALSPMMQQMSFRFTQAVNHRHGRDGPLFRGRFKSVTVEEDAQLTHVSRYIHRNPVEAGLVEHPEDWQWSSAAAYVSAVEGAEWLKTEFVLAMFVGADAKAAYRDYLRDGPIANKGEN